MSKKKSTPDGSRAKVPRPVSYRTPGGLTIVSSDEIYTESINGGICRHLKPEFFLSIQQADGIAPLQVCLYTSPYPERYQLPASDNYHCNDFFELVYILRGKISVTIEQETQFFSEHELYLIRPSVFYEQNYLQSSAITLTLCIRSDYFEELLRSAACADSMQDFLLQSLHKRAATHQFLRFTPEKEDTKKALSALLSDLLNEYKAKRPGWQAILRGLIQRLSVFLSSVYPFSFTDAEKKDYRRYLFREVDTYMRQNYFDMQMEDLAAQFHYQTNYFNRLIHEFTGKSYSEHLISIRLSVARELLENTGDGIEEIMHYIGYNNKGFFYRMFREEYAMTPAAYRRKARSREESRTPSATP